MPQLPQDIDYGKRPGLGVRRTDTPTGAGAELAEGLSRAATTFQGVLKEKQSKEDRLNYALARNEIQQADLEERANLTEDQDWRTHDKRYSEGFSTAKDRILRTYHLSPHDLAIIDSESDLIHSQGRISVGEGARVREIDEGLEGVFAGISEARKSLVGANPAARNNIVLGQLDVIGAAEDKGWLTGVQAEDMREKLTQDFAKASLDAMAPEERYRVLRDSLAYRKGYGTELGEYSGPIIKAAEDTGLPAEIIAAVIQQESSGDPFAVSQTGNAGLMQLGELTAEEMGVTDRMDPDQSIAGGAAYLSKQFDRFQDPEKALAAYNWGPKNVAQAIEKYGDDWLSHAPEETRDYVAKLAPAWVAGGDKEIKTGGKFASGQGPLTAEDIRNGLGTGSIADFLHADTAAKMLEAAKTEDRENVQNTAAQAAFKSANEIFPESHDDRMKWIRDNLEGSVEKKALTEARQYNQDQKVAKAQVSEDLYQDYSTQMETEGLKHSDIPQEDIALMDQRYRVALETRSNELSYGRQWPAVTTFRAPKADTPNKQPMSMDEWNAMPDYGKDGKTGQNMETALYYNAFTEQDWNEQRQLQKDLRAAESADILTGGQTPRADIDDVLGGMGFTAGDDDQTAGVKSRLENEYRRRIAAEQNSTTPAAVISPEAKRKILTEILTPIAFTEWSGWTFGPDKSSTKAVWLMTAKERHDAFIDLDKVNQLKMEFGGRTLTVEQILDKMALDARPVIENVSDQDKRRAAFAFMNNIGTDEASNVSEVLLRLRGE